MPYLFIQDYYAKIQDANLQQVISETDKWRKIAQAEALEEIKSYLTQKYDITDEFRETIPFLYGSTYKAKQLVYLDATAYSNAATYSANDLALQNGKVYFSIAGNAPGAFNAAEWTLIGDQYAYFYIPAPYQEFDYEGTYAKDDLVFRKDKVYKCLRATAAISRHEALQYGEYDQLPGINEYPEVTGQTQWSAGVTYEFTNLMPSATSASYSAWSSVTAYTAGQKVSRNSLIWLAMAPSTDVTPGTDITKWLPISYSEGDNRNPLLVGMNITMAIHKLSPRISSYVIPDIWVKNYDDAISWLKKCAKGEVTLDMPQLQPNKGRIRWGSSIKNINNY